MALAIDASTPAPDGISRLTTSITTTHAFSPPAGSVIFVFISATGGGGGSAQDVTSVTDNLGAHLTWAEPTGVLDNIRGGGGSGLDGVTDIYWASCPNAQTNMTITANFTVANASSTTNPAGIIQPVVFTGASTTQTGAAAIYNSTSAATPSLSLTTTANNSWVFGIVQNFNNSTVGTPGSSQTITLNGTSASINNTTDGDAFWVQTTTAPTPSSGTLVTLNDTAPTSIAQHFSMIEILANNSILAPIPVMWFH